MSRLRNLRKEENGHAGTACTIGDKRTADPVMHNCPIDLRLCMNSLENVNPMKMP